MLAVNFDELIDLIKEEDSISEYNFQVLPDTCPICKYAISPEFILIYSKNNWLTELLCGCPRNECGALFFAEYFETGNLAILQRCYPSNRLSKAFDEEIEALSPNFVSIFNQAHHAEQEKLDLICGVAYRKALEYLIKDYVLAMYPEDETKIKTMLLQQCIQKFITQPTIKNMAERATWLGNDETHYIRKWEDKDLKDLKNLIDLTVYFISMSLKALRYQEEMVAGRK
ncbi:hypothetical protein V7111_19385 [Neobacillus niacini]|uniref:hypothetical protein n=1 Tax=Neobacillus niacini TaxID=86668 RepID=UPI0030016E04